MSSPRDVGLTLVMLTSPGKWFTLADGRAGTTAGGSEFDTIGMAAVPIVYNLIFTPIVRNFGT
jgi:hypothetical protein